MGMKEKERRQKRLASAKRGNEALGGFWPSYLRQVSGLDSWRFKEDRDYTIGIAPYIAGTGNPGADPGELYYVRLIDVHKAVGTAGKDYICPLTFGHKSCKTCREVVKMVKEGRIIQDSEQHKALKSKRRQLFLVWDTEVSPPKLCLYDTGYYKSFGILLKELIDKDPDNDKGWQTFHDPEGGFNVMVVTAPDSYEGKGFIKPVKLKFVPRPEGVPDSIISQVYTRDECGEPDKPLICLDDLLIETPDDRLFALFMGEEDDTKKKPASTAADTADTSKAEAPAARPTSKPADKPAEQPRKSAPPPSSDGEGDETAADKSIVKGCKVMHKKLGLCEVLKVSPDGSSLTLQDDDGDIHQAIAPSKCELIKKDDKPPQKGKKAPPPPPPQDEGGDDDDNEGQDDEDEGASGAQDDTDDDWED